MQNQRRQFTILCEVVSFYDLIAEAKYYEAEIS